MDVATCNVESCAYKKDKTQCILEDMETSRNGNCPYHRTANFNNLRPFEHWNVYDSDYMHPDGGRCDRGIYCRMKHKIVKNLKSCGICPLLSGTAQGHGIECYWDDIEIEWGGFPDPKAELLRVSYLIEIGVLERNPSREGKVHSVDEFMSKLRKRK